MGAVLYTNPVLAGLGLNAAWPTVGQHEASVMKAVLEEAPAAAVQLVQLEKGFAQRVGPEGAVYREKILAGATASDGGVAAPKRSIGFYEKLDPESRRRALEVLEEFKKRGRIFFQTGFLSGISLGELTWIVRKNLSLPTVVLTNTGADPFSMALSIRGLLKGNRGNMSFPLSVNHVPHYMEALPRQLNAYAVRRWCPNLTTEMRCSVIDLIHWMTENPDSWDRKGNYLVASVDIFLFGVEKGTLRFIELPGSNDGMRVESFEGLQLAIHQLGAKLVFAEGKNFWDVLHFWDVLERREYAVFVENVVKGWAASATRELTGEWAKILEQARIGIEGIFQEGKKQGTINFLMVAVCQRLGVPVQFGDFIFYDLDSELQNQIREFLSRE